MISSNPTIIAGIFMLGAGIIAIIVTSYLQNRDKNKKHHHDNNNK